MTRLKLIPWLAVPALLLLIGPVVPNATAAAPSAFIEESDGMIYLPMDGEPAWLKGTQSLETSALGEVTLSSFGLADANVSLANGMLSVRFDPPFTAPYTITGISFPTRTLLQGVKPATFISVRIVGMNATTGRPDKTVEYYQKRRVQCSQNGGMNTIPLTISGTPGQTFFALFQFPRPPATADTFPFLYTDREFTDAGLFMTSVVTDTLAAVRSPGVVGTLAGTAELVDQNILCSMTCQLTNGASLNAPAGLGLNYRDAQVNWAYHNPANVLADGTAAPSNYLDMVELMRRDSYVWTVVGAGGAGAEKITLGSLPGSGLQIWGVRSVDKSGGHSGISNVTLSGPGNVVGLPLNAEDAQEANGRANESEATALTVPEAGQANTIWPAGDLDNFWFYAQDGQEITVKVSNTSYDFRNDLIPYVQLLDNSGDLVASAVGTGNPALPVTLTYVVSSHGTAFKRFIVQVADKSGSDIDPGRAPRVLVTGSYNLAVDVTAPTLFEVNNGGQSVPSGGDAFAFANAGANPVRGHATFNYVIPRSAQSNVPVRLRIYDVRGRVVSTLLNGGKSAGTYFAAWSGHDARGNRVASGPYFARIQAGTYSKTVRIDVLN